MVMMAQPIGSAIEAVDPDHKARRIYLSPKGKTFRQEKVFELVEEEHLVLLCGHYEGVDQRAIDLFIDEEISIGDYVLTGGELPAMVVVDCVARYVEGVLSPESLVQESFSENLLEYPQYTRPVEYRGLTVPEVLRSGNHAEIDKWRRAQAEAVTRKMRPDPSEITYEAHSMVPRAHGKGHAHDGGKRKTVRRSGVRARCARSRRDI